MAVDAITSGRTKLVVACAQYVNSADMSLLCQLGVESNVAEVMQCAHLRPSVWWREPSTVRSLLKRPGYKSSRTQILIANVLCTISVRGVDPGDGVLTPPWKYVGSVNRESMFRPPPKNVTYFHSKLLLDNSASFTSSRMKDCVRNGR